MLWSGMMKVMERIARMLRRWLAMFNQEDQEKLELIIQQVELEASSAPWILCKMDSSRLVRSSAQPLEASIVVNPCNRP